MKVQKENKWIGAHVSASGGVENAPPRAKEIGARAFGLFTKNQRRWSAKPLSEENIEGFKSEVSDLGFYYDFIMPHASYLINLGNPDDEGLEKSRNALLDESQRCEQLGIKWLNVHPGTHKGEISVDECLSLIAESIDWVIEQTEFVTIVIENMAGQGGSVCNDIHHLAEIIDRSQHPERVGTCIDTCHAFAAGYAIDTEEGYDDMMQEFEQVVGLEKLTGMHLNDSKRKCGSEVDRHESLGEGEIGWKLFETLVNDTRTDDTPLILETPNKENWDQEIAALYDAIKS
jgi:deoxyribonuclease-4